MEFTCVCCMSRRRNHFCSTINGNIRVHGKVTFRSSRTLSNERKSLSFPACRAGGPTSATHSMKRSDFMEKLLFGRPGPPRNERKSLSFSACRAGGPTFTQSSMKKTRYHRKVTFLPSRTLSELVEFSFLHVAQEGPLLLYLQRERRRSLEK